MVLADTNVRLLLKQSGSSVRSILVFVDSSFYRLCLAKPWAIPICQEKEQILIIQRRNVGSVACGGEQAPASEFQGLFSWILSKSILDFNSREKAVAARVQKQSPSSFSGEISRRITLTSGEKSDIIIPSIYMKSHQLNRARIFCLSNQDCQLSGWTPVGNEI